MLVPTDRAAPENSKPNHTITRFKVFVCIQASVPTSRPIMVSRQAGGPRGMSCGGREACACVCDCVCASVACEGLVRRQSRRTQHPSTVKQRHTQKAHRMAHLDGHEAVAVAVTSRLDNTHSTHK